MHRHGKRVRDSIEVGVAGFLVRPGGDQIEVVDGVQNVVDQPGAIDARARDQLFRDSGVVCVGEGMVAVGFDLALFIDHSHLGHFDVMIAAFRINEIDYCAVLAQPHLVFLGRTGHVRPSQKRLMRAEASIRSSSEVA